MQHGALMHDDDDDVAVAVVNLTAGDEVKVVTIKGREVGTLRVIENIPFGHKISMREIAEGTEVIKYGRTIGKATQVIPKAANVHVHNLKSVRWPE